MKVSELKRPWFNYNVLCSVIGAAIIAFGFYTVMWGKAREEIEDMTTSGIDSSSHKDPLLQNKSTQV